MNIEELNLDKTTYVQLKRAGVNTVEEIEKDWKRIQLLAPSAFRRAVTVIAEMQNIKNRRNSKCQ